MATIRADFWEGHVTKHFPLKKGVFSEKGGGNSVNEGLGKDFYRKGNSVKRFGPFTELPDSENRKVAVLIPFPKSALKLFEILRADISLRVPQRNFL